MMSGAYEDPLRLATNIWSRMPAPGAGRWSWRARRVVDRRGVHARTGWHPARRLCHANGWRRAAGLVCIGSARFGDGSG
jgi:hypothetical protein